jgi:hypothetical protein
MANRYRRLNEVEYEGPERMDPQKQRDIEGRRTPFSKMSPFKDVDENILDKLASEGFKDSVEKIRDVLGSTEKIQGTNMQVLQKLMMYVMTIVSKIKQKETRISRSLEELAVKVVKKMFKLTDEFQFDAKLVGSQLPPAEGMRLQNKKPSEEEIKKAFSKSKNPESEIENFEDAMQEFDLLEAKRNLVNALVQGFSLMDASYYKYGNVETGIDPNTGEKVFTDISEILSKYDEELLELYGASQAILEHLYWVYPEQVIKQQIEAGAGQVGQVDVDDTTDPVTIRARGLTFPILLHELIKGVMKTPATYVLPDDPEQADLVMQATDTVPNEAWALMFGPIMSKKISQRLPSRIFDNEDTRGKIMLNLIYTIAQLDHKKFFKLLKLVWDQNGDEIIRTGNLQKAEQALDYYVTLIEDEMNKSYLKGLFGDDEDDDEDEEPIA